jgi:hypothetical integral membrane protein (TIGR02206 family)
MTSTFDPSLEHLVAVLAVAVAAAGLCLGARLRPGAWTGRAAAGLGALLVVSEAVWIGWLVAHRSWSPGVGLPLHLCDAATLLAAAALWSRRQALVELLYFWACAGTAWALVTPDVPRRFPDLLYFQYYAAHGGIVLAALFLVVGLRLRPAPGAVGRAVLVTAVYAGAVGVVDALTGGDYLYLRRPPGVHTLFDVMGPWPWYLAVTAGLGVALFALLDAPFRLGRGAPGEPTMPGAVSPAPTSGSRPGR